MRKRLRTSLAASRSTQSPHNLACCMTVIRVACFTAVQRFRFSPPSTLEVGCRCLRFFEVQPTGAYKSAAQFLPSEPVGGELGVWAAHLATSFLDVERAHQLAKRSDRRRGRKCAQRPHRLRVSRALPYDAYKTPVGHAERCLKVSLQGSHRHPQEIL